MNDDATIHNIKTAKVPRSILLALPKMTPVLLAGREGRHCALTAFGTVSACIYRDFTNNLFLQSIYMSISGTSPTIYFYNLSI